MTRSTQPATHPEGLSMLEKRRIEAEILKEVYETLKASHGEEVAKKTIAESVEDADTLSQLATLGVNFAQGHGLGQPCPFTADHLCREAMTRTEA